MTSASIGFTFVGWFVSVSQSKVTSTSATLRSFTRSLILYYIGLVLLIISIVSLDKPPVITTATTPYY